MSDSDEKRKHIVYSIVIPAFNSSKTLQELVRRFECLFENHINEEYEIIFVDDGSTNPLTWETLKSLAQKPAVSAISLMRNYGKPGAIVCGLGHARGQWVLTIDDDLQQQPEDLVKLIDYRDHDVVVGVFGDKRHSFGVRQTSKLKSVFDRWILKVPCPMSPLKLIRAEVVQGMVAISTPRPFIPALISSVTQDIVPVPITHCVSQVGGSRYSYWRRFSQFSNLILGNSSVLLRGIGAIGAITAFSGFLFALYTLLRVAFGHAILPGWASLVIINLVFGGLILIALGINGEYLLRILENSSRKPAFLIRRLVTGNQEGDP